VSIDHNIDVQHQLGGVWAQVYQRLSLLSLGFC